MAKLWIGKRLYFVDEAVKDYVEKLEGEIKQGITDLKCMAYINIATTYNKVLDGMINDCADNLGKLIK